MVFCFDCLLFELNYCLAAFKSFRLANIAVCEVVGFGVAASVLAPYYAVPALPIGTTLTDVEGYCELFLVIPMARCTSGRFISLSTVILAMNIRSYNRLLLFISTRSGW